MVAQLSNTRTVSLCKTFIFRVNAKNNRKAIDQMMENFTFPIAAILPYGPIRAKIYGCRDVAD